MLQTLGLIPDDGRLLATSAAVIAGLTYNFLPFMILPIYASLERIDLRLIEAAKDLYASARQAFVKVTLPLTAPGIVAGVLLTFIPAFGDYINAAILGSTDQAMIGNHDPVAVPLHPGIPGSRGALVPDDGRDPRRRHLLHPLRGNGGVHGRGRPRVAMWAWLKRNALLVYAGFAVAYMLIPIAVIAVFSFAATPRDRLNFAIDEGFTLEYWKNAFSVVELNEAMLLSLELAALTTVIATTIGTMMALALVRHKFFGRRATNLLIVLPMATPEIVIGAALLSMFIIYTVSLGFTSLLIAHVMFSISFVVVVVRSRLIGFDRSIEEAAADLGATPFQAFRYVTLPLLAPGIMAAGLLAFALSVDDFVISNFNAGTSETFPIWVYGAALRGVPVQVNVLATILFVVTTLAIALVIWQQRRAERLAAIPPEDEELEPLPARRPAPSGASAG